MAVMMSAIMQTPEKPFPKPSSTTPGDIITWDNKEWLVCHYDSDNNQVYLITKDIVSKTKFGDDIPYKGSILASVAATYQTNNMSIDALAHCVTVAAHGVFSKVFIPSYEQMESEFSWFNSDTNRIAKYNGTNTEYWTRSRNYSDGDFYINKSGSIYLYSPNESFGFRPCVCVQL